jgi:spermidine/putrescine transport system substrate-binding protein
MEDRVKKIDNRASRRRFLQGTVATGVALGAWPRLSWGAEEKKLNIYNWDTYIGETTLRTFTEGTGVETQYDLFANNEELFAKLKEGNPGYDVIFPSDSYVADMISLGMLMPIDHEKIPNLKNIDPDPNFSNPSFNPGLKYGVPYMWGTVGVGYRKSKMETPASWADLLDSDKYSGRIALLADMRTTMGITLKYLGFSMNSLNEDEIDKARDLLIKQKKHLKTFAEDNGQDLLLSGECDIVMEWNGDIISVGAEDPDIAYVVPKEGTQLWTDNVCIPTGAPHPENAHAFLNHIHDAKVNAEIANTIKYATANKAARELISAEDLTNPAIYPPAEVIAACESIVSVGDFTPVYDKAWTEVQAA